MVLLDDLLLPDVGARRLKKPSAYEGSCTICNEEGGVVPNMGEACTRNEKGKVVWGARGARWRLTHGALIVMPRICTLYSTHAATSIVGRLDYLCSPAHHA